MIRKVHFDSVLSHSDNLVKAVGREGVLVLLLGMGGGHWKKMLITSVFFLYVDRGLLLPV